VYALHRSQCLGFYTKQGLQDACGASDIRQAAPDKNMEVEQKWGQKYSLAVAYGN
jgi:hypothetical protein